MELLTYTEAARLAGLTNKTIQRHVKRGTLAVVDTPVGRRIPREELDPYLGLQRLHVTKAPEEETERATIPVPIHLATLEALEQANRLAEELRKRAKLAERKLAQIAKLVGP
mgnify:CR=1 FL=1